MRITPWLCLLPLLAGCDGLDPYRRDGVWRPAGVNDRNLAAMAVAPQERVVGTGATGGNGFAAANAMERLRLDRVKPLPDSGLARIITVPGGAN